jgi:hypothetical protein
MKAAYETVVLSAARECKPSGPGSHHEDVDTLVQDTPFKGQQTRFGCAHFVSRRKEPCPPVSPELGNQEHFVL